MHLAMLSEGSWARDTGQTTSKGKITGRLGKHWCHGKSKREMVVLFVGRRVKVMDCLTPEWGSVFTETHSLFFNVNEGIQ